MKHFACLQYCSNADEQLLLLQLSVYDYFAHFCYVKSFACW